MAELKLPADPRTKVWRQLVTTLQADPTLGKVVSKWLVWAEPVTSAIGPMKGAPLVVRLTPSIGAQEWYTPDANSGLLRVTIESKILTWDADDHLNLWGAFERALYPPDRNEELKIEAAFRAAGAETGQWEFSQPLATQSAGEDGIWDCVGTIQIRVIRSIRP